jgi:hypothetical protein
MQYTEADLRFLAAALWRDDPGAAAAHLREWRAAPQAADEWLDDERVFRALTADDRTVIELSPRFLFTLLLRRIRKDLAAIPYTVERVERDGRLVVFDASVVHHMLENRDIFAYLVELLVSFERAETLTVRRTSPPGGLRRLSTMSIDDMVELAGLVDQPLRPMVFRRIGDIALFTTALFPDALQRSRRPTVTSALSRPAKHRWRLEDYEEEGRTFYRLAADSLHASHPELARVLARLASDFALARKPLHVLGERYLAWARPHWRQLPS